MKSWTTSNSVEIIRLLRGRSNVWLVRNNSCSFLVDTSIKFSRKHLKERIQRTCGSRIPDYLILTHTHFDHAANAAFLKKTFGLKIVVHESEAGYLADGYTPLPDIVGGPLKWINRLDRNKIRFIARIEPAEADIVVHGELDLSEKNIPVKLIHLPGHTNGSLTVFVDDEIAIVGDNMVNMPWQRIMPPFADNLPALHESWKKLLDSPCRIFLPSHGEEISREMLRSAYRLVGAGQ